MRNGTEAIESSRPGQPAWAWLVALGTYLVFYVSWQLFHWLPGDGIVGNVIGKPLDVISVWVSWRASRRAAGSPQVALAWRLIALGLLGQAAGGIVASGYQLLDRSPYPSVADPLYLSFYPLLLAALLALPRARRTRAEHYRLALDLAITALGAATLVWYVLIEPTAGAGGQSTLQMAFSLAYPVGDMILIVGIASLLLRGVADSVRRALWLVVGGMCLFVVGDVLYAYVTLHGVFSNTDPLNVTYVFAFALFTLAPAYQGRVGEATAPMRATRMSWMPPIAVVAGFATLLAAEISGSPALVVAIAATLLAALVCTRQLVAQRELLGAQRELRRAHDDLAIAYELQKRAAAERERMEVELRHAQKLEAVGQLAAGIAHEINTPIQYIGDTSQFLSDAFADVVPLLELYGEVVAAAKRGPVPGELLERVAEAEEHADLDYLVERVPAAWDRTFAGINQVSTIVGAMRTFAHPSTEKTSVDINEAIRNTLIVTANSYKYVADVRTELGDLPTVFSNAGDLNQVLINLVVNAAHAVADVEGDAGARGTIAVSTEVDGGDVVIRIADTGCGIPDEIADRVFDPFFTTKEVGRGTGQGLAIAHAIVTERHGGSIAFTSEQGRGTTFEIRLPAGTPPAIAEAGELVA